MHGNHTEHLVIHALEFCLFKTQKERACSCPRGKGERKKRLKGNFQNWLIPRIEYASYLIGPQATVPQIWRLTTSHYGTEYGVASSNWSTHKSVSHCVVMSSWLFRTLANVAVDRLHSRSALST